MIGKTGKERGYLILPFSEYLHLPRNRKMFGKPYKMGLPIFSACKMLAEMWSVERDQDK